MMEECKQKQVFKQPEPVERIEPEKHKPLIFDEKENRVNLRRCKKKKFYDAMICRHLCSSSLVLKSKKNSPIDNCEQICFELTKSSESSGEICPYQKYCAGGCPCKYYDCEKITDKHQEFIPVWDLQSKTSRQPPDLEMNIFQRRESLKRQPKTSGFNVMLHDFSSTNSSDVVFVDKNELFPHEWLEINFF